VNIVFSGSSGPTRNWSRC